VSEQTSPRAVVDIQDLSITFSTDGGDVRAVRGVSLSVASCEVLAVVGESGSGKTVTARSILGLLPSTATARGAVVLTNKAGTADHDVVTLGGERLRQVRGTDVAMVFQEPSAALNPVYTVGWQIVEGIRARCPDAAEAAMRLHLREILNSLPELARRFPDLFDSESAPAEPIAESA